MLFPHSERPQPPPSEARGGWRQRIAHEAARAARERSRSHERRRALPSQALSGLLMDWDLGILSAVRLRKHLRNVVADADTLGNDCHDTVRKFSRVGSQVQGAKNCHREIMKLVCAEKFEHILSATGDPAIHWIIAPHKMFNFLWSTFPDKFSRSLGLDPQQCFDCWSRLYSSDEGRRLWAEHPHLRDKTPADLRFTVPLTLFQDGGPFTKKRKVLGWWV